MDSIKNMLLAVVFIAAAIMIINGFVFSPKRQKRVKELYEEIDNPDKTRNSFIIYAEIAEILADDTFYLEVSIGGFIVVLLISVSVFIFT